jgi:hypothetical protein
VGFRRSAMAREEETIINSSRYHHASIHSKVGGVPPKLITQIAKLLDSAAMEHIMRHMLVAYPSPN